MASDTEPIIQTIELTKIYKDFWGRGRVKALEGLNLEVRRGEVFGLLGPNGSGKTTTVRLILGLLFPSRGVVRIFGEDPRDVDTKKRVGYMPEESRLYEYLNAEETLDFFGRLFGLTRAERQRRIDSLIEMVGLEGAARRPVGEFSKGMARRIGLAQALINDPDVLIMDEPTSGLDPLGARQMKDLIGTLRERGKTIFTCSHLLSDVEQICDRVCILYGGKSREVGRVEELLTEQEKLDIRTPKLSEETVNQIRDIVRREVGTEEEVEVGAPAQRLEDHFLDVIEQARREHLSTAGAEAGGPAARFLTEETEEEEGLVESLVRAGETGEEEKEEEEPEEKPESKVEAAEEDRELIEDLMQPGETGGEGEETEKEETAEVEEAPEGESVRREVIEDLTGETDEEEDTDREDEERTDNGGND